MTTMFSNAEPPIIRPPTEIEAERLDLVSLVIAGVALYLVLYLGILSALLGGMLIYLIVQSAVPAFRTLGLTRRVGKALVLALFATLIAVGLALGTIQILSLLTSGSDSVIVLLQQMADVVATARERMPLWAQDYIPASLQDIESYAARWLREHAGQLGAIGQDVG